MYLKARHLSLFGRLEDGDGGVGNEARAAVGVQVVLGDRELVLLLLGLRVPVAQLGLEALQLRVVGDLRAQSTMACAS